ncbi:alpha/beta hydrolase [Deinococcus sonorensis]|uniref:Alpha/beta hydrolase n=2 Tax=Deinococcus sonorensis TaxID=309891 RepID=A0AAU7U5F1_9DEIO
MALSARRAGHGRPLLALHGNFASSRWWDDLLAEPPGGWEVIAPDLPGFAGTPTDPDVSIPAYADAVWALMQQEHLHGAVLLGHSLGGAVALDLAARHKAAVGGLVLAASAPLGGLHTPEENYPVLALLQHDDQLRALSIGALFPTRPPETLPDLIRDAGRMHPGHYHGNARALAGWQVDPARLRGLPALVMGGALDALITPAMVREQAEALGVPPHLLPGGHGFPQEHPQTFLTELSAFLQTLS